MSSIRAVVIDPAAPGHLALQEVDPPEPGPSEAVVRVDSICLNRGEVQVAQMAPAGLRFGTDLAGVVERAAADGSGPPAGARVVGILRAGAWAEAVAVPVDSLAELPAEIDFGQAAALPVAGLTALRAVERGGTLLGHNVLVTGASGGVGHFAVQLARLGGGRVVALVRREAHAWLPRQAGADEVVVGEDATGAAVHGPYHLIVDPVGGRTLATALESIAPDGVCVTLGTSESGTATIDLFRFFLAGGATLYGFFLFHDLAKGAAARDLARLAGLVAAGQLRPHIGMEAPWTRIGEAAQDLLDRRFVGKAVLHLR